MQIFMNFHIHLHSECNLSNSPCAMKPPHINSEIVTAHSYCILLWNAGGLLCYIFLPLLWRCTETLDILIEFHITSSILLRHSLVTKQSKRIIRELTLACYRPPPHSSNNFKLNWIFWITRCLRWILSKLWAMSQPWTLPGYSSFTIFFRTHTFFLFFSKVQCLWVDRFSYIQMQRMWSLVYGGNIIYLRGRKTHF